MTYQCPRCGVKQNVEIRVVCQPRLSLWVGNTSDMFFHDPDARARCASCLHTGVLSDFMQKEHDDHVSTARRR
jgi:hypothetical protein